jgi:hypothetical protein
VGGAGRGVRACGQFINLMWAKHEMSGPGFFQPSKPALASALGTNFL